MTEAQNFANQLGGIKPDDEWLQVEIARLKGKSVVPLQQVKTLHDWLDGKRKARQSCRVYRFFLSLLQIKWRWESSG